jgi:hypothetical protein|tara:strand:- start:194 stop:427 length:234 start_codon:yes stop_codon:yes gene_type:complete
MFNPLVQSFEDITLPELEDKINELQRKYFMTSNPQVHEQISSLLDMYIAEAHGRRAVSMQKDMDNSQSGLDKLINVS